MKNALNFTAIIITMAFIGCTSNPLTVNVSEVAVNVEVKRFDKDIEAIRQFDEQSFTKLYEKYGYFLDVFGNIVLQQQTNNPNYINVLQTYTQDPTIKEVNAEINKVFSDTEIENLKQELEEAFKHYKYYYPDSSVPTIITYNSAFNYAVSSLNGALAVSLDLYLGADSKFYDLNGFPKYKSQNMDKKYIPRDCIKAMVIHNLYPAGANKTLLDQMIYNGKVLYFLDAMFPDKNDEWKISYSVEQMDWCKAKETSIWAHFIEKELLYSTNILENNKYVLDAPFTAGMPQESPGRVGVWLGWQIVKKYMSKYPKTTLHELMTDQDAQKILVKSAYKPV